MENTPPNKQKKDRPDMGKQKDATTDTEMGDAMGQ